MKHEEVVQMRLLSKLSDKFNTIVKKYKRATPKQLVLTGVFMLALAGAIGGGLASRSTSLAYTCDTNNIMYCGAGDRGSFIHQVRNGDGRNGDLKAVYAEFGLKTEQDYNDFAANAKQGVMNRKGEIYVDGQLVATNGLSMGRDNFGGNKAKNIAGKTYFYDTPDKRWAPGVGQMDVMVWFDANGTVITAIMNACGNPVPDMNRITSGGECKALNPHAVSGKKNTYTFTTNAPIFGNAKYGELRYYYQDGNEWKWFDTQSGPEKHTKQITFSKTTKVKVEVYIYLPGGKVKRSDCEYKVTVEEEKFVYTCDALHATTKDNRTFRFTVKASHSANVKLLSADFNLDGIKTNVTAKDDKGNFYKEYTFNDEKSHTVAAVLNVEYTKDGKTQKDQTKVSSECTEKVKPKQPPVCEHNPNLPPDHPDCKPPVKECKPGIPEGDERCETCEDNPGKEGCELPETGPAGIAALFAGVTAAGTIGHRLFANYRNRR